MNEYPEYDLQGEGEAPVSPEAPAEELPLSALLAATVPQEPVISEMPESAPVLSEMPEAAPVVKPEPVISEMPEAAPVVKPEPVISEMPEAEPVVKPESVISEMPEAEPVVKPEPVISEMPEAKPPVPPEPVLSEMPEASSGTYVPHRRPYYSMPQGQTPPPAKQPDAPKKKKRKGLGWAVAVIALCCGLVGSICGGLLVGFAMRSLDKEQSQIQATVPGENQQDESFEVNTVRPSVQVPGTELSANGLYTPAQVYANNVNAVVGIANEATTYNVFGQASETASSGSGFIISPSGEILTNYHVVEGAEKLTVTLYDGREYNAKVLGFEAASDVALIKIEESNLPYVTLGDSDLLYVGDEVAAIGNPLGELTYSMTVGYVSAMDRYVNTDGTPINMMQIDAAINSGNSGGPLFDMHGTVVGIITAKYSGTTGSGTTIEGIGFAIPINDITAILNDLRENGAVLDRAYMGVKVSTVTQSDIDRFGVPKGVLIESVEAGGAAEQAGLKKGDILLKLDDKALVAYKDLSAGLKNYRAGDTATLTLYRDGKELRLNITFDAKPIAAETEPETEESTEFDPWDYIFPGG
ncbi:MAG: trypsin-like peptidase domain-containing protein [Oscillospiraceae bacterium]|nr:trypsin-like peptidase domain-containing protein [Oscillospiraceae bacterium]